MGRDPATIDGVEKSLSRLEESSRAAHFKRFRRKQAVAFKAKLAHRHWRANCSSRPLKMRLRHRRSPPK